MDRATCCNGFRYLQSHPGGPVAFAIALVAASCGTQALSSKKKAVSAIPDIVVGTIDNEVAPMYPADAVSATELCDVGGDCTVFDGHGDVSLEVTDSTEKGGSNDAQWGDVTCSVDTISSYDDLALPDEASACKALGVAACKFEKYYDIWDSSKLTCFDSGGNAVVTMMVDQKADVGDLDALLPCSAAQISAWIAAYKNPCWKTISAASLPLSPITMLVDEAKLPSTICSNIDESRFTFSVGCSEVAYEVTFENKVGAQHNGPAWILVVVPPNFGLFDGVYPFLSCKQYYGGQPACCPLWGVEVLNSDVKTIVHAWVVAQDGTFDWQSSLLSLVKSFNGCQ